MTKWRLSVLTKWCISSCFRFKKQTSNLYFRGYLNARTMATQGLRSSQWKYHFQEVGCLLGDHWTICIHFHHTVNGKIPWFRLNSPFLILVLALKNMIFLATHDNSFLVSDVTFVFNLHILYYIYIRYHLLKSKQYAT